MPVEAGSNDTPGWATDVVVAEGTAYVADWGAGLRVIDIANPLTPMEVGYYDTPGWAKSVSVAGNLAYVADRNRGLRIVNVATPTAPNEIGFYESSWWAEDVAVAGYYAYIADGAGARILNVSNPTAPWEVGSCPISGAGAAIGPELAGGYVYVANADGGVSIVNIANPASPREVSHYDTAGYANDLAVADNYVYVADGIGGLVILRTLQDQVNTTLPTSGGILTSTDGQVGLIFPSGSFTDTVNITYSHLLYDQDTGELAGIGHTFDVTAVYSDTGQPAQLAPGQTWTITVHYEDAERGLVAESTLAFYYWDGSRWVREPSSVVDTVANTVTAHPDHLSLWAVLGETKRVYLPLVMRRY